VKYFTDGVRQTALTRGPYLYPSGRHTCVPGQFIQLWNCIRPSHSAHPNCCTKPAATLLFTWEN